MPNPPLETRFKKGQSGNPKGRPKKLVSVILDDLKKQGYNRVSKTDINNYLSLMINMNEDDLKKLAKDKDASMLTRIMAANLMSRNGYKVLMDILDKVLDKPMQPVDITTQGSSINDLKFNLVDE